MGTTDRPLLFVDIDGVLNTYGGPCPDGCEEHWLFPADAEPVRLCSAHSSWLHELARTTTSCGRRPGPNPIGVRSGAG